MNPELLPRVVLSAPVRQQLSVSYLRSCSPQAIYILSFSHTLIAANGQSQACGITE